MIAKSNPFVVVQNLKFLNHILSGIEEIQMERIVQMSCLVKCHCLFLTLLVTRQIMVNTNQISAFKLFI